MGQMTFHTGSRLFIFGLRDLTATSSLFLMGLGRFDYILSEIRYISIAIPFYYSCNLGKFSEILLFLVR